MNGARSYRIAELLGRGSFGSVYLADTVGTGIRRPVAIKVLRPEQAAIPGLLERLRDEARMLSMIRHRAIVRVDDLVELDGHWSVVMEYIEGCDVAALIQDGPLPPRVALAIAEEIANALHVAATQAGPDGRPLRLVHRDVKPGNIRVTAQGEVKLLDFGVARADFTAREARGTTAVYGTPTYMAPERFGGQDTHAGDVYALGVTLFEMLAGEPPGASPMEPERVPPGIKLAPAWRQIRETSLPLRDLLCAMMAAEATERPPARDCARSLARIRAQLGGMTLEDWAERVIPPAVRARRRAGDGRVGTVLVERPSQASLRVQGKPPRKGGAALLAAAGGAVVAGGGLLALLAAGGGAWWWWSTTRPSTSTSTSPSDAPNSGTSTVVGPATAETVEAASVAGRPGPAGGDPLGSDPAGGPGRSATDAAAGTDVSGPARAGTSAQAPTSASTSASAPTSARTSTSAPTSASTPAAGTTAATRPAPATGIVALDGKAESVILMARGSVYGAGEVPVGEYAAEVTLTEGDPYTMRVVTVRPGQVTTISCDARYCGERIE